MNDLFFGVKIQNAARDAGLTLDFAKDVNTALSMAFMQPAVIILDFSLAGIDMLQLIATLRSDPRTHHIPLIGFISHVETEARKQAKDAGCEVYARSAFAQNLPVILQQYC